MPQPLALGLKSRTINLGPKPLSGYIEYVYWSPIFGGYASRLSMFNDRGHEFYMIIPRGDGKAHRERRTEALSLVQEAIDYGLDPGEVVRDDDS